MYLYLCFTTQVSWEETWWEASDWVGYKELGATKTGTSLAGGRQNGVEGGVSLLG
jgi:hypothetical protein